jgi:hypothetical protein
MKFQEKVSIAASIEDVFALYADVNGWSTWDPEVKTSSIDGAFESGTTGQIQPTKGPKANITITEVISNCSFTVESKLPLCVMRFEHELSSNSEGTNALHRVSFEGLLSPLFGRVIGAQIRKGLPGTLQGLKHVAEQNHQIRFDR